MGFERARGRALPAPGVTSGNLAPGGL